MDCFSATAGRQHASGTDGSFGAALITQSMCWRESKLLRLPMDVGTSALDAPLASPFLEPLPDCVEVGYSPHKYSHREMVDIM